MEWTKLSNTRAYVFLIIQKILKFILFFKAATSCTPNPCGAHGTCFQAVLPTGPSIMCNCEAQWTGNFCETNIAGTGRDIILFNI
jgi:hypothetical protein